MPDELEGRLQHVLPEARLQAQSLPELEPLRLWLLDPSNLDRAFASEETQRLLDCPPY